MAKSANYHVPFRRRREGKTNFHRRQRLLRSADPRLVVRRSNKHEFVSLVKAKQIGDETIISASSQHLKDYGWKGATGNVPAAYLTGYLAGKYAQSFGVKRAILDIGINSCRKETRISAMLCGAAASGLEIPLDEEVFPSEARYTGKTIADYAEKLKTEKPDQYAKQFSGYKKSTAKPESLPTYFKATIKAIDDEFSSGSMKTKLTNRNKKNKAKPKTKPTTPKKAAAPPSKKSPELKAKAISTTTKPAVAKTTTETKQATTTATKPQTKETKTTTKPTTPKTATKTVEPKPVTPKIAKEAKSPTTKSTPAKKGESTTKTSASKKPAKPESSGKTTDQKKTSTTKTKK